MQTCLPNTHSNYFLEFVLVLCHHKNQTNPCVVIGELVLKKKFLQKDQIFTTPWQKFVPKSEREENDVHVIVLNLKDIKTMFM